MTDPARPTHKKYSEKLRDPRWQKKRLAVLERDEWACQNCLDTESTLHVHHRYYTKGLEPWDYPDDALLVLCEECHEFEREWRPIEEAELLRVLRHQLMTDELTELAECFNYGMPGTGTVFISALRCLMKDGDRMKEFVQDYFARLRNDSP